MQIIPYTPALGKIDWQPGFAAELAGKTVAQQLDCYALSTYSFSGTRYDDLCDPCGSRDWADVQRYLSPVTPDAVIVKDGLVVGVRLGGVTLLPYQRCRCGSGAEQWYQYLICLPAGHPPVGPA